MLHWYYISMNLNIFRLRFPATISIFLQLVTAFNAWKPFGPASIESTALPPYYNDQLRHVFTIHSRRALNIDSIGQTCKGWSTDNSHICAKYACSFNKRNTWPHHSIDTNKTSNRHGFLQPGFYMQHTTLQIRSTSSVGLQWNNRHQRTSQMSLHNFHYFHNIGKHSFCFL